MRSEQEPHTRQQLCTLNTAPYLFEASFFEKRMAQEWSVGDSFEATLLQRETQTVQDDRRSRKNAWSLLQFRVGRGSSPTALDSRILAEGRASGL